MSRILRFVLLVATLLPTAVTSPAQTANTPVKSSPVAERIHHVDSGIAAIPTKDGLLQFDLPQLMEVFKVPGLSVAVIDDYKIDWTKGYGVTEIGGKTPVTTRTLFQAGSISKPVAATGALFLVEHGKLSLDEDVNKKLVTWKVPENEFTKDQKVTLRRLMSHSAGLTVHGFPGYAVGEPRPTLVQIFNGERPANTAPIRVDFVPGSKTRYSGGGITIEQQLMIDVTGTPFPQFMQKTVLEKIGMTESSYEQPLPPARAALTATGTYSDGRPVPGKWHIYPEMAAAGLWTTPTDLAKFGIEIALSKQGKSNRVLSQAMTQEMLKPQIDQVGLGFSLGTGKNADKFGHNGADEGFQADLIMFSDSGKGIAIMGNSDNFFFVAPYVEEAVAKEYGWNSPPRQGQVGGVLVLLAAMKGTQAAMEEFQYLKQAGLADYKVDENSLNQLGYYLLQHKNTDDSIRIFKLNVEEYPQNWNGYDSLGEAYVVAGQKELAIQNYEKSVELNPKNENGAAMLKRLKEQK